MSQKSEGSNAKCEFLCKTTTFACVHVLTSVVICFTTVEERLLAAKGLSSCHFAGNVFADFLFLPLFTEG